MSGPDASPPDDGSTVDYWQVGFALLALVGLVLAAFATPVVPVDAPDASAPDVDGPDVDGPNGDPGDREIETDGGDGNGEVPGLIEWLLRLFDLVETDPEPPDGDGDGEPCLIVLDREPTPGANLTVTVLSADRTVEGASVWFEDRYVGETDEAGQVTGEVPYSDELDVRVASEELTDCEEVADATGRPSAIDEPWPAMAGYSPGATWPAMAGNSPVATWPAMAGSSPAATFEFPAAGGAAALPSGDGRASLASVEDDGNVSITRAVDGDVRVEVLDRPYPGEEVGIEASIGGIPMGNADVSLDGESVAETDDEGRATVEIPDDGSDRVPVTVSRGDFSGTVTVDVYLLEATLRPAGLVLVPGGDATVVAEKHDQPAAGAEVTVEDEQVGTTDRHGELPVVLPADPTEPLTVGTDRQTTSVSLLGLYWLPLSVLGVLTAVSGGVAHRYRGLPGLLAVLGVVGALVVVVVAGGYWWPEGSLLAAGAFAGLGLGVLLVTYRRRVRRGAATTGGLLVRLLEALVARILWIVGFLEQVLDYAAVVLRSVLAWIRSLPRSVSGLLVRLVAWIGALFGRARTAVSAVLGDRRLAARAVGAALLGALTVAVGYHLDGVRGAGLAGLGVVLMAAIAGIARWASGRASPDEPSDGSDDSDRRDFVPEGPERSADRTSWTLRQLWRAFASRVVPDRWRTRTPVEVSHAALQHGYPRTPVSELTTVFREVEYGNRPLTESMRDRAGRAYESLVGANAGAAETSEPASSDFVPSGNGSEPVARVTNRDTDPDTDHDHERNEDAREGDSP